MFKWDPEPGKLFVREIWGESLVESHLGYALRIRNHPQAGLHYCVLVEHNFGVSVPGSNSTVVDYIYGKEEMMSDDRRTMRRLASNQDIHFLLSKWDMKERLGPGDWIERVRKHHVEENIVLFQTEFKRLSDITQDYAGHPLNRR